MERVVRRFRLYSPPVYTGVVAFAGIAYLLVHRLASITSGRLAASESEALATHPSWHSIWNATLSAPYFAVLRVVHYGSSTPFYNRLVAACIGFLAALLLYFVLQRWVGWRLATLGAILFGTSGGLLHTARLVNAEILQLFAVSFLLAWFAWSHKQPKPKHLLVGLSVICVLVYTPGLILLVLLASWLNRKSLGVSWLQADKRQRTFLISTALILLAPLGYHLGTHGYREILLWLGYTLPVNLSALSGFAQALWHTPLHLFIRGSADGTFGLAHQALVNAPMSFLAVLGAYVAVSRFHEGRWRFILLVLAGCWFVAALGGLSESVLTPIICVLSTVGLAYLLSEWYRVFPRNPIARNAGLLLVAMVVAVSGWYEIRAYFVAWPHNSATRAAFICPPASLPPQGCNLVQ